MSLTIHKPEIFGATADTLTLAFDVSDDGQPVDAAARIRANGEVHQIVGDTTGTRLVRLTDLEPGCAYSVEIEVDGAAAPERDVAFPAVVETLRAPTSACVGRFATLNDLHFGEAGFGGAPDGDATVGDARPGYDRVFREEGDSPYWQIMSEDAVADINAGDVDCVIVKGDIADRGLPEQFELAARTFADFAMPHHAFLGNHDGYGRNAGLDVDGLGLLGQPPMPRTVELGGWRLILIDTVEPGETPGFFGADRLAWLSDRLDETREDGTPTLVFSHHQPVLPEFRDTLTNRIGLDPADSIPLIELVGRHPQVRAMLIGHTHQNRVRRYAAAPEVPFIEVNCVKDYPGGWARYELYEDSSFRQEVRRTPSRRALTHSSRCRDFFGGRYRRFALGEFADRSFVRGQD